MELITNKGNWEIYRFIDSTTTKAYIVRFPKMDTGKTIDNYIDKFNKIKELQLPTLNLVEKYTYQGKMGIKTEDLNYEKDRQYLSYNSLESDSQKELNALKKSLNTKKGDILPPEKIQVNSPYEEFRYRNKLDKILGLENFINNIKKDLDYISVKGVSIYFDAYFFGTNINSTLSDIDYKIVDLDNVEFDLEAYHEELYSSNLKEFEDALVGFIKYFVTGGIECDDYKIISAKINSTTLKGD